MERKEVEKIVKETIFEKMGEFTGFNHAAEINNEDGLATDMAMDLSLIHISEPTRPY